MLAFAGPGYLVAVGYMDPGNWATDLAGGARFGYTLLSVIMISNLMAILLQALAARLGIASGRDLAQACRDSYSRRSRIVLWVLCEIAIAACDLAEVIGAAIALNLLFGLPLIWGVSLTALDVLIVLFLQHRGFRYVEALVVALIVPDRRFVRGRDSGCRGPIWLASAAGFIPRVEILRNPDMLYIAIGILGATVMPHNLYLHSSIVQTRKYADTRRGQARSDPLRDDRFVGRADVRRSSSTPRSWSWRPRSSTAPGTRTSRTSRDAYQLLSPLLGTTMASMLFAVALLCSGQNATLTGTLAGQIVMEGFLNLRLRPWLRRLITRLIAIIPAIIVVAALRRARHRTAAHPEPGDPQPAAALRGVPARDVHQRPKKMGAFVNPGWVKALAWAVAVIIGALNVYLLYQSVAGLG